jgi:AcrR family transcriptional regulator
MRSDARRNHGQLLAAALEVVLEQGPQAPLGEVAARAGVGIGTLYRRFADRGTLLTAVVADALERSRDSARSALEAHDDGSVDGLDALATYLHDMLDVRVSAVIPMVLGRDDLDATVLDPLREESAAAVQRLVDAAHADGSLPDRVTFGDVGTLLVRLSRPLPGIADAAADLDLAHRQLALVLDGLRAGAPGVTAEGYSRERLRTLGTPLASRRRESG